MMKIASKLLAQNENLKKETFKIVHRKQLADLSMIDSQSGFGGHAAVVGIRQF